MELLQYICCSYEIPTMMVENLLPSVIPAPTDKAVFLAVHFPVPAESAGEPTCASFPLCASNLFSID